MKINEQEFKKEILEVLEGKTNEQKKEILAEYLNIDLETFRCNAPNGPCKVWFAKVFTYCLSIEYQIELNCFLWLINLFALYCDAFCFQHEDTVFLGCTCPCGNKQVVLYYSFAPAD